MDNATLLQQMQEQATKDLAASEKKWAAMSDEERKEWERTREHLADKMQSSVPNS